MGIVLDNVTAGYGEKAVIARMSFTFRDGGKYVVKGSSGVGKTTLLHLIAGLIAPSGGTLTNPYAGRTSVCFQDDRLLEGFSAVENIKAVIPSATDHEIRSELAKILPLGVLKSKVSELSGGQRRRVCVVRACMAPSELVLIDEPLTGLDDKAARNVVEYIVGETRSRTVIVASHSDLFDKDYETVRLSGPVPGI